MFNRSEILTTAWAHYRRDVFKGIGVRRGDSFSRSHFAYCLRMAWAVAKERAARQAQPVVVAPAAKPITCPTKLARAVEIKSELEWMQYGERTNWTMHANLAAELAGLSA